jgi:dTDP-4-dehydrorhamnose reductase
MGGTLGASKRVSKVRLLLTGASGQLGSYLLSELARLSHEVIAWSGSGTGSLSGFPLQTVELGDTDRVVAAFREARPTGVIHAAAVASVAECYRDPERARQVNVGGTRLLTELAAESRARLLFVSTDLVFSGNAAPYQEGAEPAPLSGYGRTKAEAETIVLGVPRSLAVRVSLLFGPSLTGRASFFEQQLAALRKRKKMKLFEDEWRTPIALPAAARALLALVECDTAGVLHLGGPERLSRLEMGRRLAGHLGLDPFTFVASRQAESPAPEPRPRDVSLDSGRWRRLFPQHPWAKLEDAFREMLPGRQLKQTED